MVCKSCGATVKDGQFTCSSCGAYLSKDSTVKTDSLEERASLIGGSNLYSHRSPVVISEGWKWYAFMTWGIILLWSLGNLFSVIDGFKVSALIGLTYLGIAILGFVTHSKLVNFSASALPFLYALLFSPLYIVLSAYLSIKKYLGDYITLGDILAQSPSLTFLVVCIVVFAIINIVYFQNRKDEFQY